MIRPSPDDDAPSIVKPHGWRWPIFSFPGAEAERAKPTPVADYRAPVELALATGEKVEFPRWEYPLRSASGANAVVGIDSDAGIDVECANGARFIVGDEVSRLTAGVFRLKGGEADPSATHTIPFRWVGGVFDASRMTGSPRYGLTIIQLLRYSSFSIRDAIFYAGISTPSGAGIGNGVCDTAISVHRSFGGVVENCQFVGFYDSGVYVSGDDAAGDAITLVGETHSVSRCRFIRCSNAITYKRNFIGLTAHDNFIYECGNGIFAGSTGSTGNNHGRRLIAGSNRIYRTRGRPIRMVGGRDNIVRGNVVVDWGKHISDDKTFTTVSAGNRCAAIDGGGITESIVANNICRQEGFAGGTADAGREPVGIQLRNDDAGRGSHHNLIVDNKIVRAHRTMLEVGESDHNRWQDNETVAPDSGHIIQGANSVFIGQIVQGAATVDPQRIDRGKALRIDIPIPGAAAGDWVDSWSHTRPSLDRLEVDAGVSADKGYLMLKNNTGRAIDIGNTIWRMRIRKA